MVWSQDSKNPVIKDSLQIPQPVTWLEKEAGGMGTNALHARSHLKATGLCKGVQEEVSGLSYALGNQTGMRLKVGFGRNEGSKNRWSRCWKPADKQDSLAPRFGPRGTAGGVSQVGNVDIVI